MISIYNNEITSQTLNLTKATLKKRGLNKIDIFIDNSLKRFTSLFAAAGHPNCVFEINFTDLQKITNGSIMEITE